MIFIWILVFIVTVIILIKSADYFTSYAEKLGTILKISPFIIGVVIVAVGTSMPELATSIFGVIRGETEFLPSIVLGSSIANILLILGIATLFVKKIIRFNWDTVANDMPFLVGAVVLLGFVIIDGKIVLWENILLVIGFVIYIIYSLSVYKIKTAENKKDLDKDIKAEVKEDIKKVEAQIYIKKGKKSLKLTKIIIIMIVSLAVIVVAANYVVDSLIQIATILGLGTSVLAASAIAIGTSLPELTVALSAARKGNFDMVLGNIMGSNVFNILVIFGIPGLFTTISISIASLYLFLPVLAVSVLIMWLVTIDRRITKPEGAFMILLYCAFLGKLFDLF